ncbi:phenylalanyl-tRNA synthetase beta chain [Candidatus Blochmanniella floridana]|uniref:Phenylalanine--tRNA ligase beta subunit n=1 Tax=Blochmanniella floridana TaxID=203907 RepID=SYFB_BLOFL|nr:RecName: Full=Phenylalanine--tRNA ligase beta subunit; AltName: Full=Phenylalanyl-tRNA synthetase beta subunit; Short=PheRS [Candidatus Blochmannia floridanus]CAD83423.1 phenylalanyl-tRNA synthetase beta chain [Candidatus Blochmannia floridanus]
MKFSESWIREWVNPPIDHDQLIDQFTLAGLNVEESRKLNSNKFYGIVIAKIIECQVHPSLADTWIMTVNSGGGNIINIITNNMNYNKNTKVVVANIGAILPNGNIIKQINIQGRKSEGVLCTFSMLGLNYYTQKGIIELPIDAPIGCNFYDYLHFNDNIIDINITPNRGDCLSVIGLSREIAAINQCKLKKINIKSNVPNILDTIPIIIETPHDCPKFLGKVLKNIDITIPTPLKIQEKLIRCGIQPINIITDIANYVLLELGQPVRIFDYEKIDKNIIYVRFSKPGETLTLSENNINIKLFSKTLVISDVRKPLAIAGVITGNQSSVSCSTHNIFLKVAFFNPLTIINQYKLYNLYTSSVVRYEKGIDPDISELALNYATSLLIKYCHGKAGPTINIISHNHLPKIKIIKLHRSKLNMILGFYIPDQKIINILTNLGFQVETQGHNWIVSTPSWRFDINIEENVISEIIRIYGYNHIPKIPAKISLNQTVQCIPNQVISLSKSKTVLIARGYQEIITYSFVDPNIQKLLHPQCIPLTLMNPISTNMSVMRLSLWTGLIQTMLYNQNRQHKNIKLFESGICFIPKNSHSKQVSQQLRLSGIRSGLRHYEHWDIHTSLTDFYDIKGDVESILYLFNKKNQNNNIHFKSCTYPALHPGQSAEIYLNDIFLGYVGVIHPMIQYKLRIHSNVLVFELIWDSIVNIKSQKIIDISKFPKNYRDISLIIPTHISASSVIETCKKIGIINLTEVKLIDVYTGRNIPTNFKSLTIKLTLQSKTHTLKEQEIKEIIIICTTTLKKHFNAIFR